MKKILVVMVLSLVGFGAFANEDPNIEKYLEMKMEVQNLENELEQKDKADLIGLRELEDLTIEADEFFEKEVLGWEDVELDTSAKAFPQDAILKVLK